MAVMYRTADVDIMYQFWMDVDWQVKMLQALGMKSTLITDGNSPINLFTTANGLVGNMVARRGTRPTDDDDE